MSFQAPPPRFDAPGRGRIYDSVLETIGNTPLVRVPRFSASEGVRADLVLKLEFFNPLASVKDRIALGMVMDMEADGRIHPGRSILIEPTSGNTGIGLAFLAASRGYRLILTMPESMSIERRRMLAFLGAEVELTPKEKGMSGAIARAREHVGDPVGVGQRARDRIAREGRDQAERGAKRGHALPSTRKAPAHRKLDHLLVNRGVDDRPAALQPTLEALLQDRRRHGSP